MEKETEKQTNENKRPVAQAKPDGLCVGAFVAVFFFFRGRGNGGRRAVRFT